MDGKDNKEDKTREEADMTLSRSFQNLQKWSKSVQKCPGVVQIHILIVFTRYPSFGSLLERFEHFCKNRASLHDSSMFHQM